MEDTEFGAPSVNMTGPGEYKRLAQAGNSGQKPEPVIAQEGDYPNGVILIRAGFALLSRKFGNGNRTPQLSWFRPKLRLRGNRP